MSNPQQPELARSRKASTVTDEALPTKAAPRRAKSRKTAPDTIGPIPEENRPGHQPDVVPDKPLVPHEAYRADAPVDDTGESSVRFAFRFDRLLVPFAAAVGVLPATAWVRLDDDELVIRFGPWILRTQRTNVAGCEVTGPYRMIKVVGPPHLSLADRGITFATNRQSGACIRFHEPVGALLPRGMLTHPAATVTVTNPDDLARRLSER